MNFISHRNHQMIGLVGFIGSGKTTVSNILQNEHAFVSTSFASILKDCVSSIFGWKRELLEGDTEESRVFREQIDEWWSIHLGKTNFTPRFALQHLGTEVLRNHFHNDIWILALEKRLQEEFKNGNVVIADCRFPNEIDMVRRNGGRIVWIQRGADPEWIDIAKRANRGSFDDRQKMSNNYGHVHISEWAWLIEHNIDVIIENNGTLQDLGQSIKNLLFDQT